MMRESKWMRFALIGCTWLLTAACSPAQKRPLVATALDNPETRRESFEATLRVLDAHPKYVDEMFAQVLQHPKTLDRLLQNTADGLRNEPLARRAARHLAAEPAGLKMTLLATLNEIEDDPKALTATAAAIEQRPDVTVKAMIQRESATRRIVRALVEEMQRNPEAERQFMAAMRENSGGMAAVLTDNPEVMAALFKAISKSGLRRGSNEFDAFLSQFTE